jgi:hypothetical protein
MYNKYYKILHVNILPTVRVMACARPVTRTLRALVTHTPLRAPHHASLYAVFRHRSRMSCSDIVVICRVQTSSRVVFRHRRVSRSDTVSYYVVFRHCRVSCSDTVLSHVVFRHCPKNASHAPNKLIIFQGKSNILCSCAALLLSLASFALSSRSGLCMSASCATSSRVAT